MNSSGKFIKSTNRSISAHIGDTLHRVGETVEPLAGFQTAKAMVGYVDSCLYQPIDYDIQVFAGVYPMESNDFPKLEESINRVSLC